MAATKWSAGAWRRPRTAPRRPGEWELTVPPPDTPGPHEMPWTICSCLPHPPFLCAASLGPSSLKTFAVRRLQRTPSTIPTRTARFSSKMAQSGRQRRPGGTWTAFPDNFFSSDIPYSSRWTLTSFCG